MCRLLTSSRCVTSGSGLRDSVTLAEGLVPGLVDVVGGGVEACVADGAGLRLMSVPSGCGAGVDARGAAASGAGAFAIGADAAGAVAVEADAFEPPMFFQLRYPAEEADGNECGSVMSALVLPPPSSSSVS